MAYKNQKRMLHALEAFARLCKTLYRRFFEQNLVVRSLLRPSFKLRQLVVKKTTIFNFPMERCKPAIGQKNNEKQANNARQTAGELLGHFPSKISLYLDPKPSPRKTHRHRNAAMVKTTMTSQSKLSVPFLH